MESGRSQIMIVFEAAVGASLLSSVLYDACTPAPKADGK